MDKEFHGALIDMIEEYKWICRKVEPPEELEDFMDDIKSAVVAEGDLRHSGELFAMSGRASPQLAGDRVRMFASGQQLVWSTMHFFPTPSWKE